RAGGTDLSQLRGLGHRMPWSMGAIVVGGLSLVGVPLTVGFISKWYLVLATFEAGLWPLGMLVLLGSLLTLIYVWRIVEVAYFSPAPDGQVNNSKEAPLSILIPAWILVFAN